MVKIKEKNILIIGAGRLGTTLASVLSPKLRALLWSLSAEISRRGLADLGLRSEETGKAGSCAQVAKLSPPKPITRGLVIPDSSLSPEERWQQIISGGVEERHGDVIQGPPDSVAESMLEFLTQNKFV